MDKSLDTPLREVKFSQVHRRTHRHRRFIVSQFNDARTPIKGRDGQPGPYAVDAGVAWHFIMQTDKDGPWTALARVEVGVDAPDDEVALAVARHLASPGWSRDAL